MAELVLWKTDYGNNAEFKRLKNQPIEYSKLVLEANNRSAISFYEKVYHMPAGTNKVILLNLPNVTTDQPTRLVPTVQSLLSVDANLDKYRLSVDNIPTTDKDITYDSSLFRDRIYRALGREIRSLKDLRNGDVDIIAELILTANEFPLLDVRMDASSGNTLSASVVYLYNHVTSEVKL